MHLFRISPFSLREKVRMREWRKSLNGKNYSLALQALTPALENLFPTFSADCILAVVSRRKREFTCYCDNFLAEGEGEKLCAQFGGSSNTVWRSL